MTEPRWLEIERLQREIAERQTRLMFLVLGDPFKGVGLAVQSAPTVESSAERTP